MTGKGDRHGQGIPHHLLPLDQESRDARRLREDRRPRDAGGRRAYENGLNQRTVVVEFDSLERALAAHDGPGYQEALRVLGNAAERDVRLVEGVG